MIKTIKQILQVERIPPIIIPFIVPFLITYFVFKVVRFLLMWMFGFWKCIHCKKIFWAKEEIKIVGEDEYGLEQRLCSACNVSEILTKYK